ncbi:hypothetical protein EDD52_12231 [Primorskyibacter sedentarius]|uniref:Glycosyl transferase family 1 n=1 Tax=Primorskyibacter sedentarius TaxID=745311 RepID=A0A4R3J465_9RHOB|nr:hypothetical protein [Primorskyibacter sedentarius]TCS59072.1 hypothetical protein EDD52_12231 [Primorskyibacter sedentarius]
MNERPLRLELVYQPKQKKYGSVELRVFQLAQILERYAGRDISVKLVPFRYRQWYLQGAWALARPRNTAVLFSKSCLKRIRPNTLKVCRWRGCTTLIDYVDGDLDMARHLSPDVHLAASFGAERELLALRKNRHTKQGEVVRLLHHNTDTRLEDARACASGHLSSVYIGDLGNTVRSPALEKKIRYVPFERATEINQVRQAIASTNFHICVRNLDKLGKGNVQKPFTKGFLAAHVGAPVLAWRGDAEARHFLGDDYPYFIDSPRQEDIMRGIVHAEQTYGTALWNAAIHQMEKIHQQVNNKKIAESLVVLLKERMGKGS